MSILPADTVHWSIPWTNETEMLDVTYPGFEFQVNTILECPDVKCPNPRHRNSLRCTLDAQTTLRR